MDKTDGVIFWGLIGLVALLVVAALIVGLGKVRQVHYETADTPEATFHNFIIAVNRGDYEYAYSLLAENACKPPYQLFRNMLGYYFSVSDAEILSKDVQGDHARLIVRISFAHGGALPEVSESDSSTVELVHTPKGWRISKFSPDLPFPPLGMSPSQCPWKEKGGD